MGVFTVVPLDETLVREGVHTALAIRLFDEAQISLGKAAELAGMTRADFMAELARLGIPAIRNEQTDLEHELSVLEQ